MSIIFDYDSIYEALHPPEAKPSVYDFSSPFLLSSYTVGMIVLSQKAVDYLLDFKAYQTPLNTRIGDTIEFQRQQFKAWISEFELNLLKIDQNNWPTELQAEFR